MHGEKYAKSAVFSRGSIGRNASPSAGQRVYLLLKRGLDCVLGISILLLCSPLFLFLSLFIRLDSCGPAFFRQTRVGRKGRPFTLYKFRTMFQETPGNLPKSALQNPDDHMTRVGKWLRKTSLDELPQLFNVVRGEMSLVGPRPLIPEETKLHRLRKKSGIYDFLRPGMTGWAQINGRDMMTDEEKWAYDREYLHRLSFFFDCKIFFITLWVVAARKGYREGNIPNG